MEEEDFSSFQPQLSKTREQGTWNEHQTLPKTLMSSVSRRSKRNGVAKRDAEAHTGVQQSPEET